MSKKDKDDSLIELKKQIQAWGFDNNDLTAFIERSKKNIHAAMNAILTYLYVWHECLIISRWRDQLMSSGISPHNVSGSSSGSGALMPSAAST